MYTITVETTDQRFPAMSAFISAASPEKMDRVNVLSVPKSSKMFYKL